MTSPTRVVFLGSGDFAMPILDAIATSPTVELVGVVTTPPRPAGRARELRPTPVAEGAAALRVPVLLPERLRDPMALEPIAALRPGLLVLADYGKIVPASLLEMAPLGALNLHPSLLPRHRGATPVPAAITSGDADTGVSLIQMDAGIDTGPIVAQRRVAVRDDEDSPALEARLAGVAAELLIGSLPGWIDGTLPGVPQPSQGATLTRPFRREDGRLDPTRPAIELERQVRALRPWPGTFLERPEGRVIVADARVSAEPRPDGAAPGDLVMADQELALVTADGLLELVAVQPAGGRRMRGTDLVRGRPAILISSGGASPASPGAER